MGLDSRCQRCILDSVLILPSVFACANGRIVSLKVSDLSPLRRCDVENYYGSLTISVDDMFACTHDDQIVVLDKASLVERSKSARTLV